jgi:hypothetical protein
LEKTLRSTRSRLLTGVAAVTIGLGSLLLAAPAASADASGCTAESKYPSCIQVKGSSTRVNWIRGGAALRPYDSARGYFKIWDSKGRVNRTTGAVTLKNDSFMSHTKWGPTITLNTNLPNGDQVCAAFYQKLSSGSYKKHSPACKTIKK